MEVDATLRVPGMVYRIGDGVDPAGRKVCVSDDGRLYIEGQHVGTVLPGDSIRPDATREYIMGQDMPVQVIVHHTAVDCVLEFERKAEVIDRG